MPTAPGIHVIRTAPELTGQQKQDLPEPFPGSGLGQCSKCQGDLCVANRQVVCDRCGMPHKHPKMDEIQQEVPAQQQITPETLYEQNAGSWIDRILRLEKVNNSGKLADLLDHQADLIRTLTRRVAKLEGLVVNGNGNNGGIDLVVDKVDAADVEPTPLESEVAAAAPPADQTSAEKRLTDKPPNVQVRRKA